MAKRSVIDMGFSDVFLLLIQKAERKGQTRGEVYQAASWLTGYTYDQIDAAMESGITYGAFFSEAPDWNPRSDMITGRVCGVYVEAVEDFLMKRIRQMDKLVDELAQGKPMESVTR